ncbi:MAG TPA: DUF1559 domain-containing protein [Abditibacteriaceae bacterium]
MSTEKVCGREQTTQRGFTLIELLIAITIIAILASILFPVFTRARESARRSSCLSNLKQIGVAATMYSQDYDETLFGNADSDVGAGLTKGFMDDAAARNWPQSIFPYSKSLQILICPSAVPYSSIGSNPNYKEVSVDGGGNTSYAGNQILADRKLAAIPTPDTIVLVHEFRFYHRTAQMRPKPSGSDFVQFHHGNLENSHFEGGSRLFCDGHAKWTKKTRMTFADYGAGGVNANLSFADTATETITQQNMVMPSAF